MVAIGTGLTTAVGRKTQIRICPLMEFVQKDFCYVTSLRRRFLLMSQREARGGYVQVSARRDDHSQPLNTYTPHA